MSRPFGSGFSVSKSIRASLASIGSDFLYPTAFIGVLPSLLFLSSPVAPLPIGPAGGNARIWLMANLQLCCRLGSQWPCRAPRSLLIASLSAYICGISPPGFPHERYSLFHGIVHPFGCVKRDSLGPARPGFRRRIETLLRPDRAAGAAGRRQRLCR